MSRADTVLAVRFGVRFLREYHVGAGHGGGTTLDAALFTETFDGAEQPAIRAGHGLLRQALFDLLGTPPLAKLRRCPASGGPRTQGEAAYCLPSAHPVCPVCAIFGSPAHPSPWRFSTLRPREPEVGTASGGALARVVSRTAMDAATRRARTGMLFSQELGAPQELVLDATRAAGVTREEALDELALLVAAARAIPAAGAGRRRGRGECAVGLLPSDDGDPELAPDALLERFGDAWLPEGGRARAMTPARPRLAPGEAHVPLWARTGPADWEEVELVMRLDEPVIAGSRPLTGNLLEAESFIPGSLLLGALAEAVVRAGGTAEAEFLRAFVTGGVSFPDLLPAAETGAHFLPSLPAPRDLHTCSLRPGPAPAGHGVRSSLAPGGAGERGCPACGTARAAKPQRLEGYLVDPRGGGVFADAPWRIAPALREETKIAIDPLSGRVEGESLYHRQAIPTGTLLSGTLLAAPGALEPLRRLGLLEGEFGSTPLHLGKRNGRGYGRVRLHWRTVHPERTAAARSATHARIGSLLDEGRPFPLVAAARVLLRDRLGRAIRTLSPAALGLEGEGDAAVALRPVGGFRGHVGLPRREAIALAPGSVLWLHAPGLDAEARARAAARLLELVHGGGAGERGEEGYGRFRVAPFPYTWVDPSLAAEDAAEVQPIPADLRTPARKDGEDDPLGRDRERRLLARYSGSLRGQELGHDEWRTVARLLRARAGERHGAIVVALEEGGGEVARALAGAKAERKPRSFLRDGKGQGGWVLLRPLLAEAAADQLTVEERAFRTRVLADALTNAANPGKVRR